VTEKRLSNWQELNNLVEAIERMVVEHGLRGSEIFIFTNNLTEEAAFWKGTSSSRILFKLVLRLKELEMKYDLHLHIVHVSGRRMVAEGADGLSRADHGEGVMLRSKICCFIPLHLDPVAWEKKVGKWIEDITPGLNFKVLDPSGWFNDAHKFGNFVWNVPPDGGSRCGTTRICSLEMTPRDAYPNCSTTNDRAMATPCNTRDQKTKKCGSLVLTMNVY
jgi:hypothetical protein